MQVSEWTPNRIRELRGRRTQEELGKIVRVAKNTVWRWEAGYAKPGVERSRRLTQMAEKECFVAECKVPGSAVLLGDLEEGSLHLAKHFKLVSRSAAVLQE